MRVGKKAGRDRNWNKAPGLAQSAERRGLRRAATELWRGWRVAALRQRWRASKECWSRSVCKNEGRRRWWRRHRLRRWSRPLFRESCNGRRREREGPAPFPLALTGGKSISQKLRLVSKKATPVGVLVVLRADLADDADFGFLVALGPAQDKFFALERACGGRGGRRLEGWEGRWWWAPKRLCRSSRSR